MNQKGFSHIVIIMLALLVLVAISTGYILHHGFSNSSNNSVKSSPDSPVTTAIPSAPVSSLSSRVLSVTGWKQFSNHFGEYTIDYPDAWETDTPYPGSCDPQYENQLIFGVGCAIFSPTLNIAKIPEGIISLTVNSTSKQNNSIKANFKIAALGSSPNAQEIKTAQDDTITFTHGGVLYKIKADYEEAKKEGFGNAESVLPSVIEKMASSISFLNKISTCAAPALKPLTTLPQNFSLSNYHLSDGTDPLNGDYPKTPFGQQKGFYEGKDAPPPAREFEYIVNYTKSGGVFTADPAFLQTVAAINPDSTTAEGTELWHVNCVDTQEDNFSSRQPFEVSTDDNDPFGVHLYGNSDNSTKLWGVNEWNIPLLQKTRNTVYVRMGTEWQKYTATGYFATMPPQVGAKPAIYLYPQKTTNVKVTIHPNGTLINTDGLYNKKQQGWDVSAAPDGTINGVTDSLYYEAMVNIQRPDQGYAIAYSDLFPFLGNYVKQLGLNDKESSEFVEFWRSRLKSAPYYYVAPLVQSSISNLYPLSIQPTPDTLIRVELYLQPLNQEISISPPKLSTIPTRSGFTAVEWGGIYQNE